MAPLLLCMNAHKEDINGISSDRFTYKVIFKNGDDLRQDQLILQIIDLMNSLLKSIHLDLKLTPYRALACGTLDGYLEFCPNSKTIQDILKENDNSIENFFRKLAEKAVGDHGSWFFRKHVKNDEKLKEITDMTTLLKICYDIIMDNYIDSCAGYCVITYILGIGDRHLENLMMNDEGIYFYVKNNFKENSSISISASFWEEILKFSLLHSS
jgi:phosphatidylinositol 3-kinase